MPACASKISQLGCIAPAGLGAKRAIIAIARLLLTAAYYMLLRGEPYQEHGVGYHDELQQKQAVNRLRRRMEQLGYKVTLEPPAVSTA